MSQKFYSENEENNFEESLNNYEYLFKNYIGDSKQKITLEEALIELFRNAGASINEAKQIYDDLYLVCNNKINQNWEKIRQENKFISKRDALIISSYTYEAKPMYSRFSPYRLLNTNLVANDRKNGVRCVEKYFFLFLKSLRSMEKCKKAHLFRCIGSEVKLEKDPNNSKYVPYKVGNEKTFWPFTSTSDIEKMTENFLNNGKGTKYKIVGDDLWGYDITLFNVFNEREILLEPERKYLIEKIHKGNLTEVTCRIKNTPQILLKAIYESVKSICPKCGSEEIEVIRETQEELEEQYRKEAGFFLGSILKIGFKIIPPEAMLN